MSEPCDAAEMQVVADILDGCPRPGGDFRRYEYAVRRAVEAGRELGRSEQLIFTHGGIGEGLRAARAAGAREERGLILAMIEDAYDENDPETGVLAPLMDAIRAWAR